MHRESIASVLARWLFAVTLLCIRIFRIAMRYNKADRDCRYWSLLEIVSPHYNSVLSSQIYSILLQHVTLWTGLVFNDIN